MTELECGVLKSASEAEVVLGQSPSAGTSKTPKRRVL